MVNGFNISYKFYPKDGAYFTRDFSKKEVLQAVDYFDKNSPASTFMPKDFGDLCSTIDTGMHKQQAEFALGDFTIKSDKEVLGCYSPRTVAGFKFGTSSTLYQQYGCTGDYNNPSKCTVAANSAYVKAIHENAYRGYAYPYDDWHADYSTSRHTSLVFDIE